MNKGTVKRWTRGLLPSLALLFLAGFGICYLIVATWGLPRFVCTYIEDELHKAGIPVSIGNLRITIFSGLVIHADDICLDAKLDGQKRTVGRIGSARVDISISELFSGNFDIHSIRIGNAEVTIPTQTEIAGSSQLDIGDLHADIEIGHDGNATIENAGFTLQGMHVSVVGRFPLDLKPEKTSQPTTFDLDRSIDDIRPTLGDILAYTDRITWNKEDPPSLEVRFNQERDKDPHVEISLTAPQLGYQGLVFHRFNLSVLYTNDALIVDRCLFHSADPIGWFNMTGRLNLTTRELRSTLTSSIPLIRWYSRLTNDSLLPPSVELEGLPDLKAEVSMQFTADYKGIETMNAYGDFALNDFSVGTQKFSMIEGSFYYKDEALYIHDFSIRTHTKGLSGSLLAYDRQMHVYLDNRLPASVLSNLINELGKTDLNLPTGLKLEGTTDFTLDAHMAFPNGWNEPMILNESALYVKLQDASYEDTSLKNMELHLQLAGDFTRGWNLPPVIQHCMVDLKMAGLTREDMQLDDLNLQATIREIDWKSWKELAYPGSSSITLSTEGCSYNGENLGNFQLQATTQGDNIRIGTCTLKRHDGTISLVAESDGALGMINLDSDFPLHVYQNIFSLGGDMPSALTLPKKANIKARATVDLASILHGEPNAKTLKYLYLGADLDDFSWKHILLQNLTIDGIYEQAENNDARLTVSNFLLKHDTGELQCVAKGSLLDKTLIEGKSSIRLDVIDKLVEDPDLHDIAAYFKWKPDSKTAAQFTVSLNTLDPGTGYAVKGNAQIKQVDFRGVDIDDATTYVEAKKGAVLLRTPVIVYNNRNYLQAKKKKGSSTSKLTADSVLFDLQKETVAVNNFRGTVFPDYSLRMFAPAAARTLDRFQFQQAVTLAGSGIYPLGDDMGSMSSAINFNTNGLTIYPLLGTNLQLVNTTGRVEISPQWVKVKNLNGIIWNGSFSGQVLAQIDGGDALNAELQTTGCDLSAIAKSYDTTLSAATVNNYIAFTSSGGRTSTIKGSGHAEIRNGNLVEFSLFSMIGRLLGDAIPGLNHVVNYNIQQATFDYTIDKGYLNTGNFTCSGTNIALAGNGNINLDTLYVNAFLRLRFRGLMGIVTLPIYLLTKGIFEFRGAGPLENVSWTMTPYSGKSQSKPDPPAEEPAKPKRKR